MGLDPAAERVYRAMLAFPGVGVAELADATLLTEHQVRDGLDLLGDLALLRASREQTGMLRPVSEQRAMAILIERQAAELEARRAQLEVNRNALSSRLARDARTPPTGQAGIERLLGMDAVQDRLEELMTAAATEVLNILPGGPQTAASLAAARPVNQDLAARGLELRCIYQDSMRADRLNLNYAHWLQDLGVRIRTTPLVPPRMILIDRAIAVVPIEPQDSTRGAALLREPGVLASLFALFEQTWHTATDLDTPKAAEPGQDTPTPAELELLKMVASGITDQAAANRLGISLRTVRRRMEDLMNRLEATSRFEAGLKAAKRGWL
ncbi:LuxR C-terminal-related transcriptional regulator [Kitasatospora sp. NPDC002227]|uniref:helix-turn-helix transcriptional regulator n=1 Tax=Kitasatospora sp. NPDC002227 TaxID=3154773 RepID=UPI00332D89F9